MDNMAEQIQRKIINFVTRNFMVEEEEIIMDESLIDQGIIDSLGLVEITTFIEKEYHIDITEEHMTRANFGSIIKITGFIMRETA